MNTKKICRDRSKHLLSLPYSARGDGEIRSAEIEVPPAKVSDNYAKSSRNRTCRRLPNSKDFLIIRRLRRFRSWADDVEIAKSLSSDSTVTPRHPSAVFLLTVVAPSMSGSLPADSARVFEKLLPWATVACPAANSIATRRARKWAATG
jgi:hypothetical protein